MKKYVVLMTMVLCCIFFVGCKANESSVLKNFSKKIEKSKSYHLTGTLEMINGENNYLYDVDVSYKDDDLFKVSLKNQVNNHEQVILKNKEGVYVLTPSLNKSFKFQSEWPYNNSQIYLLQTLLSDIKNDKNRTFEQTDNGYIFTTVVNYTSHNDYTKQKIMIDKDYNITEVQVLDDEDNIKMKMTFDDIDYKTSLDDSNFTLDGNVGAIDETHESVNKIDDIIYPMYIPEKTSLSSKDVIETENGERVILTFSGDKPFMLVQETVNITDELETTPVYGEPTLLTDTIGALTESSITWLNNGIEYYVVSDVLSEQELVSVAKSVTTIPLGK